MARPSPASLRLANASRGNLRALRPSDLQDTGPRDVSPLELGLVEQPTRPRSEYTMAALREAIRDTDNGMLRQAADLTRAAMAQDAYARGVLGTLTEGLWGLPMNFIGDPRMIAALTDSPTGSGQWREMFPQPEAIRLMKWGVNLGVGIGQMRHKWREPGDQVVSVEEAEDGSYQIRRPLRPVGAHSTRVLRTWDPKWLRHQWWDDSWWLMTADREIRITPNDGEWLLYMPYGSQKPWEEGAWMALCLAFVLSRDAMFDQSRHAEVLAPVRVGKVPQGSTQRQRQTYLRQIREMQRMSALVLPPGLEYSIVESTGRINDLYKQIIDRSERQYCLLYTGNETTTKGTPGFSQGDVQERIAKAKLKSLSGSLAECLRSGGLIEWSVGNYGSDDPPLAQFDCDPPEDKLARAKTVSEAGDSLGKMTAGLASAGLRITQSSAAAYAQSFGFVVEPFPAALPEPVATEEKQPVVAQAATAQALRADEVRALAGFAPFGDPRGDMVLSALNAPPGSAPPAQAPHEAAPPAAPPTVATVAESDDPPTDDAASALAAKMTAHGIPRCEHERPNRCLLCGVERTRDFDPGLTPEAGPTWRVAWRPIGGNAPPTSPLVAGYNPDQSRADDGKFGEGGAASGGRSEAHEKARANAHEEHSHDAARERRRADQLTPKLAKAKERRDAALAAHEKILNDESAHEAHEAAKAAHADAPTKKTEAAVKASEKAEKARAAKSDAAESARAETQEHYDALQARTVQFQARAQAAEEHLEMLKLPHEEYRAAVADGLRKSESAERIASSDLTEAKYSERKLSEAYRDTSRMSNEDAIKLLDRLESAHRHAADAEHKHEAASAAADNWRTYNRDAQNFDDRYGDHNYESATEADR